MRANMVSVMAGLVLVVGSCWAETAPDEVPFKEGQTPPKAGPNEVWCLVHKPAQFKTVTETVETRKATFYFESVPAKFEKKAETVQVAPETKQAVWVPDVWKTEKYQHQLTPASSTYVVEQAVLEDGVEKVLVRDAYKKKVLQPAKYKTETETIEVSAARTEYRVVDCDEKGVVITRLENKDDCYTLVEIPAQKRTIAKTILVEPEKEVEVEVPAEYKEVHVKKVVKEAATKKIEIPATFETREKCVLVTPGHYKYETDRKSVV